MQRTPTVLLALGLVALLVASCQPEAEIAPETVPGSILPSNFPAPVYGLDQNPPTKAGFELGRALFYDPRLSRDGTISCGSCHQQFAAFSHAGHTLSHGIDGRLGTRNAPALQNLRWQRNFLWDGGSVHIETMPVAPLTNAVEMDETMANVVRKLNADASYAERFAGVFGTTPIDSYQLLKALAQFTAALTSANSRYDHYVRHESGGTLNSAELRGLAVLTQKCTPCHGTDLFTDNSYRNNGLDRTFAADSGRAHITQLATDRGTFKVPSLRNVARTAPYMHDGRFQTLEEVLNHYASGVQPSPTLDPLLNAAGSRGIALGSQDKDDLLAFLQTLTDEQFLTDKRLSEKP
ncbi:cytochrome-c peroxidase [Hymenobacter chitinivorans]|uniref:Cytochrome c peroxidase n=1 Tax=Hymenobacter chitinivorans DSM 11115 TaxID=1121954 RepID=A0A2M9BN14_9BACT|nr:cytochrome c peroxidase [Hymenobacter chitinivorans]PJJ59326.1 cytochrome c peroxidase [Hymenobacter chitinivorans DSM 11115]